MAATQPVGNPRHILTEIVQQMGDLSQALMSDQSGEVNNGDLASNNTVEEEVRSIFTGHRATTNPTGPDCPVNPNEAVEAQRSSATTAARRQLAVSSAQSSSRAATTPLYNARRYFNNQRTVIRNRRSPSTTSSCRSSRLGRRGTIGPFTRDLILLSGPGDKKVPRQGTKVFLQESGHIINAFQFMKEWSDIEVILQIAEAFIDKIPTGTDFEILHSVHTTLVTPTLASGQNLTGSVLCRIFRDNKPVYVRPSVQILKEERVEIDLEDDISNLSESKYDCYS